MNMTDEVIPFKRNGNQIGKIRTISNRELNLIEPDVADIHIDDIAWALARQVRYNGHIKYNYTVSRHCLIMSYLVAEDRALEALLHDAAEAYVGDIIWPLKKLFPEIEEFEERIGGTIMTRYGLGHLVDKDGIYRKSRAIGRADIQIAQHEGHHFDRDYMANWSNEVEQAAHDFMLEHHPYEVYNYSNECMDKYASGKDPFINDVIFTQKLDVDLYLKRFKQLYKDF